MLDLFIVIFFVCFLSVDGDANSRREKWDMLSQFQLQVLFALFLKDKTCLTNFISVCPSSKITHGSIISISVSSYPATIKYYAFGAAESMLTMHYLHVHFHRL